MSELVILAIFATPYPFSLGASENPKPGKLGTMTWNAFLGELMIRHKIHAVKYT